MNCVFVIREEPGSYFSVEQQFTGLTQRTVRDFYSVKK